MQFVFVTLYIDTIEVSIFLGSGPHNTDPDKFEIKIAYLNILLGLIS